MKNDHKLGNPSAAHEAARLDDLDDDCVYWDGQTDYPLGVPNRILEVGRENLSLMLESLHGETTEQRDFRIGDHQPDETVSEGVSDHEILRNINSAMSLLSDVAQVRAYSMGLVERLTPLRSRALVGLVQRMAEGHTVRIEAQNRNRPDPASIPASPYVLSSARISASLGLAHAVSQAEQQRERNDELEKRGLMLAAQAMTQAEKAVDLFEEQKRMAREHYEATVAKEAEQRPTYKLLGQ